MSSQISLSRIHDNSFSNLFQEGNGGTYTRINLKSKKTEKVRKINDVSNTDDIKKKMLDLFESSKAMIDELHKTINEFK